MRLVCVTEEWIGKYLQLCSDRNLSYQPWPSRHAILVADGKELVAGVMVYDTTGPFAFFEHLVTNETATLRQRHRAVDLMAAEMMPMCRHLGKVPSIHVRHPGIKRILHRYGLASHRVDVMTCHYKALEKYDYEREDTQSPRTNPQLTDLAGDSAHRATPSSARPGHSEVCAGVPAPVA